MTSPTVDAVSVHPAMDRPAPRDGAIDVARAMAILGMFVIHAVLVLADAYPREGPLAAILWLCDGRAAATFVTLAGFGVARLVLKHSPMDAARRLRRRAAILWALGCVNLIVWPGDILRVYGVALLLAPAMLRWSARARVLMAGGLILLFVALLVPLDWARHWQLDTLTYVGVWTPSGFVRNLFFDGFRPVVPWLAFFLLGTVLAEVDLQRRVPQVGLLLGGSLLLLVSVLFSVRLDRYLMRVAPTMDALTREGLVGTTSLPPMPLFMTSALGSTAVLLGTVLLCVPHLPDRLVLALAATGRRALTWYLLHIALLMSLYAVGLKQSVGSGAAILVGVGLFCGAALWSYRYRETTGLLESMLRRMSATAPPVERPATE